MAPARGRLNNRDSARHQSRRTGWPGQHGRAPVTEIQEVSRLPRLRILLGPAAQQERDGTGHWQALISSVFPAWL